MTSRVLPPEEWPRLVGTEAEALWPTLDPEYSRIVVVERDGEIVACHVLMNVLHVECLWIHPESRGKASVGRRLWHAVQDEARATGVRAVMTHADSDQVRGLLERAGAVPLVGETFMVPIASAEERRDLAVGRAFHRQLETQLTHEHHADDRLHDAAVGQALRTAIERGQPEAAVGSYNAWAGASGYVPIQWIEMRDGAFVVDMQTAVIAIDAQYRVTVIEERSAVCQSQQA